MAQELGPGAGKIPNQYASFCTSEAKDCAEALKKSLLKYAEKVCIRFCEEPTVIDKFKTKIPGASASVKRDPLDKTTEKQYLDYIRVEIGKVVDVFLTKFPISQLNISTMNHSIVSVVEGSTLFTLYKSINNLDWLKKKLVKLYE